MDERTTGRSRSLDRPIHGACVVAGCWCHDADRAAPDLQPARRTRGGARGPSRLAAALDLTAWRTVGLPVA